MTIVNLDNFYDELLREKQQHLEQLIKERELERAEVAKFTLQADRAETALSLARKDCAKFVADNEKLKQEVDSISRQLDDERQRVEDLLFRAEEDNISKDDLCKYKEKMDQELSQAMQRLSEMDAARALATAAESAVREQLQRMQLEAETQSQQQSSELLAAQALSSELQKLIDEAYSLLREKDNEKDELSKALNEEISKMKLETEKHTTESKSRLAVAKTEFEGQIAVLSAKLQAAEAKVTTQTQGLERAKEDSSSALSEIIVKLEQSQAALDDKTQELAKVIAASKEQEVLLKKDINKSKMELSSKQLDIETLSENVKKMESAIKSAQDESEALKEHHAKKINELEGLMTEMSQNTETLSLSNKELQRGLQMKQSEIEKLLHDSQINKELNLKLTEDFKKSVQDKNEEVTNLQQKLTDLKTSFDTDGESRTNEYRKQIDEKDTTISTLTQQIVELKLSANLSKQEFSNMTANVNANINEIKKLTEENEQLKHKVVQLNEANNVYTSKISGMELEIGDLKRNIQSHLEKNEELLKSKEKLENDIKSKTADDSDNLAKTISELHERERELVEIKDQVRERHNQHERIQQELGQQIQKIQADNLKAVQELSDNLKILNVLIESEKEKVNVLNKDLQTTRDDYEKTIANIKEEFGMEKEHLLLELDKKKDEENILNEKLQALESNSDRLISELNSSLDEIKSTGQTSEIKLKEKLDQLIESQNDLNNKLELARTNEQSLQASLSESVAKFNEEKIVLQTKLKDTENKVLALSDEAVNVKSQLEVASKSVSDKENIIKEINLKYAMLEVDIKANSEMLIEKDNQIHSGNNEIKKMLEEKHLLERNLNKAENDAKNLQQRLDLLGKDKAGNDSIIQSQQVEFEKVQKQVETITLENQQMETLNKELKQKLESVQESEMLITNQFKDLQSKYDANLSEIKKNEDLINKLQCDSQKLKQVIAEEEQLKSEILKTSNELLQKNAIIENLNGELNALKDSSTSSQNELAEKFKKFESENTSLKEKYSKEVDSLQKTLSEYEKQFKESQKNIEELQNTREKIGELQSQLLKSEEDIKQLNNISTGQKRNYEDISAQLRADYDKVKKDGKKERHTLRAQIEEIEKVSSATKIQLESEVKKSADLQKRLEETESKLREFENKVELLTVHQEKNSSEREGMLERLTIDLQNSRKKYDDRVKSDEDKIGLLSKELDNNKSDLEKQVEITVSLQKELKNFKAKTEIAQREKHQLEKEMTKLQTASVPEKLPMINNNVVNTDNIDLEAQKLLEEKQIVEGQVDFLNSVIVDMQRKNEQLVARVHALETGFTAQEADELNYSNGTKNRSSAPRLFCDICDVWDAHDTEDCPRQAADEDSPPPRDASAKRPPPAPRPYCEVCEVFGHATEDCNEDETY